MRKLTRMEANKEARRALAKHGVDLSECQYSCSASEVRLSGYLQKIDGSGFCVQGVEALIMDFQRHLPGLYIAGECENWKFSSDFINQVQDHSNDHHDGGDELEPTTYYIDLDDVDNAA